MNEPEKGEKTAVPEAAPAGTPQAAVDLPAVGARAPAAKGVVYAWWLVLCLVGLDYFSALAYLPSMAVQADPNLAPLAALAVVAVTLLAALPVYLYVVGRSPDGHGAIGLLERLVFGWSGKVFILILLGFVATDVVITRTLSVADAAKHITHNSYWQQHVEWVTNNKETVRRWFPAFLQGDFFDFWNEQLVITVVLSVLTFGFYAFIIRGFNRPFLCLAAAVVLLFLVVNGIVIGYSLAYLVRHPERLENWFNLVNYRPGVVPDEPWARRVLLPIAEAVMLVFAPLWAAPQLILGLSGFELSMTSAPLVRGRPDDDPARPRGRIRRTRLLLVTAALIMSIFLLGSVLVVTQLVPHAEALQGTAPPGNPEWNGPAMHRALAYLAHGSGNLNTKFLPIPEEARTPERVPVTDVSPLFGPVFGTVYDVSAVLILCLAGASVTIGLRDLVPQYLARYGMQLRWAQKIGVILHLFNVAILVIILVFHASVSAQQWAYGASVLVLLTGASLAALLDLRRRWEGSVWRGVVAAPFLVFCALFVVLVGLTFLQNRSGLYIPLVFILVILGTAFASRWVRSTELRFEGFAFADEDSQKRWEEICQLEFQVLVPHRPGGLSLAEKDAEIRARHRLGPDVPIIYVEAELGDPSDFVQTPVMKVEKDEGFEVVRVSRCASVAHVLAAIGLEFRHVGRPPEIHFGWSEESPLAANLHFLLFGEGNIPWMVHALIRRAEPDDLRRPRVVIG
jgi:hypothetical protein